MGQIWFPSRREEAVRYGSLKYAVADAFRDYKARSEMLVKLSVS